MKIPNMVAEATQRFGLGLKFYNLANGKCVDIKPIVGVKVEGAMVYIRYRSDLVASIHRNLFMVVDKTCEDVTEKFLALTYERPPLGLKPQSVHNAQRYHAIVAAMKRYREAGVKVPKKWATELIPLWVELQVPHATR